jgi:putative transposase
MSKPVRKSHNVSILIYHYECPAKYRRVVFDTKVDEILKEVCLEIAKRYEFEFIEIGTVKDHVHFLIQSVPMYNPKKIIQTVESLTA